MCKLFSFITNEKEEVFYFNNEIRQEIRENKSEKVKGKEYKEDSHTSIAHYFGLDEDKCNKFEIDVIKDNIFVVDQINIKDNSAKAKKWAENFVNSEEFKEILNNLTTLDLSNNQLTNVDVLKNCPNLTTLYLYNNQLTNVDVLKNCPNLTTLYLYNNQLTNVDVLKNCPNLTTLDLDSNQLTNVQKEELKKALPKCYIYF